MRPVSLTPHSTHLLSWSFSTSSYHDLSLVSFIPTTPPQCSSLTCLPEYVVDCVIDTVDCAMGRPSTSARGRRATRSPRHIEFSKFVTNVLTRAEVTIPVVLVALAYVDRAKPHLHIALEEWACERVFLGAVMLASKVLNLSSPLICDTDNSSASVVPQRLHTQERPLGALHRGLRKT